MCTRCVELRFVRAEVCQGKHRQGGAHVSTTAQHYVHRAMIPLQLPENKKVLKQCMCKKQTKTKHIKCSHKNILLQGQQQSKILYIVVYGMGERRTGERCIGENAP